MRLVTTAVRRLREGAHGTSLGAAHITKSRVMVVGLRCGGTRSLTSPASSPQPHYGYTSRLVSFPRRTIESKQVARGPSANGTGLQNRSRAGHRRTTGLRVVEFFGDSVILLYTEKGNCPGNRSTSKATNQNASVGALLARTPLFPRVCIRPPASQRTWQICTAVRVRPPSPLPHDGQPKSRETC